MKNIATALANVALAANLYAAEPEHVTAVRNYIIENGRHEVAHNFHSCTLTTSAKQLGYGTGAASTIEILTNCGPGDTEKLLIITVKEKKNSKISVLVDGSRQYANEASSLDGKVDLAIVNSGNGDVYVYGGQEAANYFQPAYDELIKLMHDFIQK